MISRIAVVAFATMLLPSVAAAQVRDARPRDSVTSQRRAALEGQLRERVAMVVKQRLQLTDAQSQQLQETARRFEQRRRDLLQREQGLRRDLRAQLAPGVAADQQRVASLLDQILAVHRERVTVTEQEQRELARFLTPVQRAQYLGLQAQLRSRIEGMRQGRGAARPGAKRPMRQRGPAQ